MKIIIGILYSFFTFSLGAQIIYFDKQYDYQQVAESPFDIKQLDSSYLIIAGTNFEHSSLFLNIDYEGNTINTFTIPPALGWYGSTPHHIFKENSNAPILQGTTAIFDPIVDTQIFLAKIDAENEASTSILHYGSDTLFESTGEAINTHDGGFAVAGWVFNNNYGSRVYLMKMDSLGNLEFYNHFTSDSTIKHEGLSLVQTQDDGFLILGFRRYGDEYEGADLLVTDRVLFKVNAQGIQEWIQLYPADTDSLIKSNQHYWIIPLEDGNYLSGGYRQYFKLNFVITQETFQKYVITKYTPEGDIIWDKVYGENYWAVWNDGIQATNENLVFVGLERNYWSESDYRRYAIMSSTDSQGELLWHRKYYSAPDDVDIDFFNTLIEAPDGGYVACGHSFGPWADSTYQNVWVIKTDSIGCLEPHCDSIFTAVEEPLPIASDVGLLLYPNPTTDQVTIDIDLEETLLGIQLFDPTGKKVEDIQFFRSHHLHSHTLSLAAFPSGIYFVYVRTDKGWRSGKVVRG